jgi:hypothetical protein
MAVVVAEGALAIDQLAHDETGLDGLSDADVVRNQQAHDRKPLWAPLIGRPGFGREGRARTRTINITTTQSHSAPENAGAQPSAPSASSASMPESNSANGLAVAPLRTVANVSGRLMPFRADSLPPTSTRVSARGYARRSAG